MAVRACAPSCADSFRIRFFYRKQEPIGKSETNGQRRNEENMYKLLIVDDEPLVQAGIKSMLNWQELNIELCGIAMNGQAALDIIEQEMPDIVITDIKMPIMSGLELIRICRERYGKDQPAFIILTSYEDFQMAKEALQYQVTDYLVKLELTAQSLRSAIEKVLEQASTQQAKLLPPSSPSNMQGLYDKFFMRLLNNLFDSPEQFELQSRDLNLHFQYSHYVCCYLEIISNISVPMTLEKQAGLYGSTLQMLKEIVVKYIPCRIVSLDLRHCAILFYFQEETLESRYSEKLKNILHTVSDTLHKYYNVSLTGGIGTAVTQPLEIGESYQYARQAFSSISEEIPFACIEDCGNDITHSNLFNISLFKDDLSRAFEEYDAEALHQTLTDIINLFSSHSGHYVKALDGACNILYLSLSLLSDGEAIISGIFSDYPDSYRSIYRQSTVEQITGWLTQFRDGLCQVFTERKKEHKNHIVTSVKKYIAENIRERLTLNEVAALFGISPNYLSQLFKKYNDVGFNEYVTSLKIKEAKTLLSDSTYKIYEIADMLGFESAFYFSKVFKKVEGISPTEYQNQKII